MSRLSAFCEWLLRQSVVWGCMACFASYVLVIQNLDRSSALYRCFAGDNGQIKMAVAGLFFMGVASLALKLFGVAMQFGALTSVELPATSAPDVDGIDELEERLRQAPAAMRNGYLVRRLQNALNFVRQRRSADGIESHLHRLEESDWRRAAHGHAAVRMIAAIMVVLGVIGTVVAMPAALGSAADGSGAAMPAMVKGMSVAMEPTLQALALCLCLALARYGIERVETRLLSAVGEAASRELVGRFPQVGSDSDPHVASVRRASEQALAAIETAVGRHESALTRSIGAAGRRWEEMASAAAAAIHRSVGEALAAGLKDHAASLNQGVAKHASDLEGTLIRHAEILSENIDAHTSALADALEHHTAVMTETEKSLAAENRTHLADMEAALGEAMLLAATRQEKLIAQSENLLKEVQAALVETSGAAVGQQEQLVKQSDVLLKVVEATGQIRQLEDALNRNLSALGGSHNFEQTAASLAAAVQLLAARLHEPLRLRDAIDLGDDETTSQAA